MSSLQIFEQYPFTISESEVARGIIEAKELAKEINNTETLKSVFGLIDLTTLNPYDNEETAKILARKVNKFSTEYPDIPNVAAVCVYPTLVKTTAMYLKVKTVGLASVGASFPSSQTFLNVKLLECKEIAQRGATDVDIVLPLRHWYSEQYDKVYEEIKQLNEAIGYSHLKVILETGILKKYEDIWKASLIAMEAGAEFIKTSTGKTMPAATPEAVFVMSKAIKTYYEKTGKPVGIKPAGGISTPDDALLYYAIVKMILGDEWLNKKRFRIGASKLANNLLQKIISNETGRNTTVEYF